MEAGWAYRPVIEDLRAHLPAGACLKIETDPAMRAMLRYHLPTRHGADCSWLLVSADRELDANIPPTWEGARPRLKRQGYRLYHLPR
jgi:hypothetical protein